MRKPFPSLMNATWALCVVATIASGQNPSTPAPSQPSTNSTTSSTNSNKQPAVTRISGRLLTNGRLPQPLALRLEGQAGEQVAYANVEEGGEFDLPGLNLDLNQLYYIVVKVDGFKSIHQPLNISRETVFSPRVTIFLEPDSEPAADARGASVVNVKQLGSKIPDKAIDEYKKARKESASGNYAKAVEHLERALQLAPDYYEAQNNLGAEYLRAQRFRDAEKAFEKAQMLNPLADEPLINLGSLYYQEAQIQSSSGKQEVSAATFQKAVVFLQEAIRKNPRSATAHQYLGAALYRTGSYDQAESTLRQALELDNRLTEAEFVLLNVYTRQKRYTEALRQIESFLKKNPTSAERAPLEALRQQIETALKP